MPIYSAFYKMRHVSLSRHPLRPQQSSILRSSVSSPAPLISSSGNAAAVFQDCDIHCTTAQIPGQKNMVIAQERIDPNQNTGIVIQKCRIEATSDLRPIQKYFPTYLGQPWKEYSRTIICNLPLLIVIVLVGMNGMEI
ncbi:Pectinesterase [Forsythia ovata]|uniref:Pectinesterase n=1 Tax=Forsythia ovata TaxID=205694 RepID=A0ABD1X3Z3_9LAMI